MSKTFIDPCKTGYFSKLICDYIEEKDSLKPFYNRFPVLSGFRQQIEEKRQNFDHANRKVLVRVLRNQYSHLDLSEATDANLEALLQDNCFTITTGHQLNLFTGPLYFLYKIVSTIKLTDQLQREYPDQRFVPVYWMATEDHDFEEINFFNFHGKTFRWSGPGTEEEGGAVGRLPTEGLDKVSELLRQELGKGSSAEKLLDLFEQAYIKHSNLADATRFLADALFGEYGLVIIDADNKELKSLFEPYMVKELKEEVTYNSVSETISELQKTDPDYTIQVNPRNINLFYLETGLRERIFHDGDRYGVTDTEKAWKEDQLLKEVHEHPERFSPNVLMRPLYQEVILPNLCYIGGGGELAYWLQLRHAFNAFEVTFPVLLLRNSALIMTDKQRDKLKKLQIGDQQLFLDHHAFINRKVREISDINIDFTPQKEHLIKQFEELYSLAEKTDKSFLGAVKAQEVKQLKGLAKLEKRLLKAQKRKLSDQVERMTELRNELFPNGNLQERSINFSNIYLEHDQEFIRILFRELEPLKKDFTILSL
ncbi:bacillithiol biosynthesis cysteine-adding enzyme BshC [Robertkochia aurantiaca]|uniref:bacillithiol biosynthesis cysteine-adding enzyme BshC n=1 Tax=Robertkochia aurantiaca TaxID=2873700 RepID=UPI001CC9F0A2|nr:bacillithiol biosynthesis cysteine-adding enzyme BshC [Robertkochia sp. 3YJGBD-33]